MIVDIVINIYNKEKSILNTFNKIEEELKNIKHRYIFVDDCSTDKSLDILKSIHKKNEAIVKIISLSKKSGKDIAIYTGICHTSHELICIYDTDLQANVSHITKMYETIKNNSDIDSVCMYSNYKEENFFKKTNIKLLNKIYHLDIDNNKTYYRMFRKNVLQAIKEETKSYMFSNYSFELIGFNTTYVNFDNNNIDNTNLKKYINYSNNPFNILKNVNIILITLAFVFLVLTLLKVVRISNNVLLIIIFIFSIINITILNITCDFFNKQKTYYTIKEKIGFDDNVL